MVYLLGNYVNLKKLKKKVHKLIVSSINPYKVLGISSHENDYRLSWALNRKLDLQFRKTDNLLIRSANEGDKEFSVFQSDGNGNLLKLNLISNRCADGFLIREMKNIDFILQIFGDIDQDELDTIAAKLKTINLVSTVFEIIPDNFKKPEYLPSE